MTDLQIAFGRACVAYRAIQCAPDDASDALLEPQNDIISSAWDIALSQPSESLTDIVCKLRLALALVDQSASTVLVAYDITTAEETESGHAGADMILRSIIDAERLLESKQTYPKAVRR